MKCADEREVDSAPSVGQSRPRAPRSTSGCHGGRLGSVSAGTETTSAPPMAENDSLTTEGCVSVWGGGSPGDWIRGDRRNQDFQNEVYDRKSQEGQYISGK